MKKIINNRVYDTDTAKFMGYWNNGQPANDFSYCEEQLYRKRTGEFFLLGKGGAASGYAERCGNMWQAGEAIRPLTYEEARQWAERRLDADDYIAIFGDPGEGEDQQAGPVWIDGVTRKKLRQIKDKTGMQMMEIIAKAVDGLDI